MHDVNALLAKSLGEIRRLKAANQKLENVSREPVAIVGSACRYPGGVRSMDELWQFLREGGDGVVRMTDQRWPMARYYADDPNKAGTIYSDAMGLLDDIDRFDAALFGLKPEEARHIDPQHRLLMELAWEAIEDAGHAVESLAGSRTGVYVGIMNDDYGQLQGPLESASPYIGAGIAKSCAAGRLAFTFGLEGPAIALDSACSSSLVGTHLALQALRRGECDLALAGGVNLILSPQSSVVICRSHMLSRRGHCYAFDQRADGYVRAEGGGLVLLKRLSDAQRDGDRIYAVIRGSAVNHDGRSQGLTAPSGRAQRQVIAAALADAGVAPHEVAFVECHGTGTALGDPIEIRALEASYVQPCAQRAPLLLGAVKANFGHMESAAGIGGLHKAVQVVRHRQVPKNPHFETINPQIRVDADKIRIPVVNVALDTGETVRAAVSSFGFSGTNAHVVIESHAAASAAGVLPTPGLFKLSAHSSAALADYARRYRALIAAGCAADIHALCYTAAVGRGDANYRIACSVNDLNDLDACLEEFVDVIGGDQEQPPATPFPAIWTVDAATETDWHFAADLYARYSRYRDTIGAACARLQQRDPVQAQTLAAYWSTPPAAQPPAPMLAHALHRFALAQLLSRCGLAPTQVAGFGYGEFVAAAIAGMLTPDELVDALLDGGVPASWTALRPRCDFVSTQTQGAFDADIWRADATTDHRDAARSRQSLVADFVGTKHCGSRYAHLAIGAQLELALGAALEHGVFHWVHGATNRDPARRLEGVLARCYMAGAPVHWAHVHEDCRQEKCSLPSYPFQRERHWTDWGYSFDASLPSTVGLGAAAVRRRPPGGAPPADGMTRPLHHRLLKSVACCPSGARNFHGELSLAQLPCLAAHRVFGDIVVPASLYIDLIATAGQWVWPDESLRIDELRLQRKCVLGDEPLQLYCHLRPDDGVAEIYTKREGAEWQRHVRASLSAAARQPALRQDLADYRTACAQAVPVRAHYHGLGMSGLNYGPEFQGIFELWHGQDCALAKIALPPSTDQDLSGHFAHPVLMDACLQAISAAESAQHGDVLLVPASVRGVRCYRPLPEMLWCFIRTMPADAAGTPSHCAALTLLDRDGEVVMTIDRFETTPLRESPGAAADVADYQRWLYEKHWRVDERLSVSRADFPALDQIRASVRAPLSDEELDQGYAAYLQAKTQSDRLAAAYILEALESLGVARAAPLSASLLQAHGVLAQHAMLSRRLLAILCEAGCARVADGDVVLTAAADQLPSSQVLEHAVPAAAAQLAGQVDFFARFGRELAALLTGRRDPLGLLFADDNEARTENVYHESDGAAQLNQLVAAITAHACAHAGSGRRIRILEVGAGTGATTAHVLPRLAGLDVDYVFTDISPHFLQRAREKFSDVPFLQPALLDIAADPATQSLPARSFDIVIAVNVLHATPDIRRTLANLNHYLRHDGLVVLKELTRAQAWVDMTFGFTEGWWSFTDHSLRRDGPLLDARQWVAELESAGFEADVANARSTDADALEQVPESVIFAAKRRSAHASAHWVLFSNQDAASDDLEEQLIRRGDRVSVICRQAPLRAGRVQIDPAASAAFDAVFADAFQRHGAIAGAIYAWSLSTSDALPRDLAPALELHARYPLYLCQTLLQSEWREVVPTFLTRGAQPVAQPRVEQPLAALLWGHAGSFVNENGRYARLVDLDPDEHDPRRGNAALIDLLHDSSESQLALRQGSCYINRLRPTTLEARTPVQIHAQASYLITGGFGALGLETALELARQGARHLLLLGRDPSRGEGSPVLARIHAAGAQTYFVQADVADEATLRTQLTRALDGLPPLRGVVHSVGVLADGVVAQQTWQNYLKVFAPKVLGSVYLHRITLDHELDFFILYSSAAAILGNPGQANHAAANTFMDSFAWYRRSQSRPGLSVDWGGWSQIGAAAGHADTQLARADSLIGFIPPGQGIEVIARQFASEHRQFAVIPLRTQVALDAAAMPYLHKLLEDVLQPAAPTHPLAADKASAAAVLMRLRRAPGAQRAALTRQYLAEVIGALLGGGALNNYQASLFDLGLDSLLSINLRLRLETELDCRLPSTLLHDNPTLDSLSAFLLDSIIGRASATPAAPIAEPVAESVDRPSPAVARSAHHADKAIAPEPAPRGIAAPSADAARDVAIIGISGRYPGAEDVDALWDNLVQGRDAVSSVPAARWDHDAYFDPRKDIPGKSYCAWGGFIDGVDQFDPLFFNISPRMAAFIDPKERLFLETAWNLLEDAGHTREILQRDYARKVGVFVGAMYQLYPSLAGNAIEEAATALSSYNAIANRVSYFFDLRGPSVAVDTMCSSSLTAIDLACQSLIGGGCRLAIAGGVNLSIHPKKYIGLSQAQIVAGRADSRSFSDGDGFIPAEAVGAVLLKPLAQAIADGDRVLAVIKSSLTNHGGHSSGYFAPNADAQVQLIRDNFSRAGIAADTIGYVEAAANGAALGDALEFRALSEVFGGAAATLPRRPIGTVKSNIGHPEAASGIAQLTKVVLQLQHRQLVPSIGTRPLNPDIDLQRSPFYLVDALTPWQRLQRDGKALPLRAAVSSFGAGGANAHLIVEEYGDAPQPDLPIETVAAAAEIVVLSAHATEQLAAVAQRLSARIRAAAGSSDGGSFSLANLAHTLQVHREAMDCRAAFLAADLDELARGLEHYAATRDARAAPLPTFVGNLRDNPSVRELLSGRAGEAMVQVFLAEGSLDKVALHWVQGGSVAWSALRGSRPVRRISLPTYPFARSRYWLSGDASPPSGDGPGGGAPRSSDSTAAAAASPLAVAAVSSVAAIEGKLAALLSQALQLPPGQLQRHQPLTHYGFDSMLVLRLARAIEEQHALIVTSRDFLECPTLALLAERVAARNPPPESGAERDTAADADIADGESICALSEGQAGLWLIEHSQDTRGGYNVPIALRLHGALDGAALERACAFAVERHPVLKTHIRVVDGIPQQVVTTGAASDVSRVRYTAIAPGDDMLTCVQARAKEPFQLDGGALARFDLFATGAAEHVLLLTVHHLIFDGTSAMLLLDTLLAAYADGMGGRELAQRSPLPSRIAYHDYVRAEQQRLAGARGQALRRYWQNQLAGELAAVLPPPDRRGARAERRGGTCVRRLDPALAEAVRTFAAAQAVRPSAVFLAAFKLFLGFCSGETDIVVGMPVAMRHGQDLDQAVGYFVNLVAMRSQLAPTLSFRALTTAVQYTMADALDHAELPFPALVKALRIERQGMRSPVFQTFYAYQNFVQAHQRSRRPAADMPLRYELLDEVSQEGEYDFGVQVFEIESGGFRVEIKFDHGSYQTHSIEHLFDQWLRLLRNGLAVPDRDIGYLASATGEEAERIVKDWNNTYADYPRDSGIAELFQARAARHPQRVALVDGTQQLSYAELERRASRLARQLTAAGVRRHALVGICMHRCIDMVVGLLAIVKAGAAYVPLDPSYPESRLAFMLADAAVSLVLTEPGLAHKPCLQSRQRLVLDGADTVAPDCGDDGSDHAAAARAGDLAYVIYTSGSTGVPKGVLVEQRSVVRLVVNNSSVPLSETSVVPHLSSISFDAATFEIWGALLNGGRLVLYPDAVMDPLQIGRLCEAHAVTLAFMTTRLFDQFVVAWERPLRSLERLLVGGEVVSPQSVDLAHARHPRLCVSNIYGPTENTTFSVSYPVPRSDSEPAALPIGRAIANSTAYVLDEQQRLVAAGGVGELYVGGDGVARGYLNRPELDAERFIADPFASRSGARLYRTGDRARWSPDGQLEFLGRRDRQVKVRGFRVELGEVEAALLAHAGVREAAVLVRPDMSQLLAYVVAEPDSSPTDDALRAYLRQQLPEYMVPALYLRVEHALPLTPNGKLDVKALPLPPALGMSSAAAAATPEQEVLAGIWAELLQISVPDIDADFFALGGHSLLAMQAITRLRERLHIELPVRALFEGPTIRQLAEQVLQARRVDPLLKPALQAQRRGERAPASFAQERLWFLEQLALLGPAYHIPVGFRLDGVLDQAALERSLAALVQRHESLRTRFETVDGEALQVVVPTVEIALTPVDLSALPPAEQALQAQHCGEQEILRPFDLLHGPLLRAALLRFSPQQHALLLTIHHIVADGWSMGVLARELGLLYRAEVSGTDAALPPLPVQYADYAVWQRHWLQGAALEQQMAYWKQRLAGAPEELTLPGDRPRPSVPSYRGTRLAVTVPAPLSAAVAALARREGVTVFMVLLGVFQLLLSRWSGQADVVVGSPIAGRTERAMEGLIGFFVNTLALRLDLSGNPSFRTLLGRVRDMALDAYAHQDLPFEKLVQELQPVRNLSRQPVFQAMFVLQNAPQAALELPGLRLQPVTEDAVAEQTSAKFDLTLSLAESAEGLVGSMEFALDLFNRCTAERMAGHFHTLLDAVVTDPDRPVAQAPLLAAAERQQLLDTWNATATDYPAACCIHELFEAQAAQTPHAPAVQHAAEVCSYAQLNARANRLAHHLREHGVGPDARVAICIQRSTDMLVGLLAILKAGGAYVPLDPVYPVERLQQMLADSAPAVVLTHAAARQRVQDVLAQTASTATLIDLHADATAWADQPATNPAPAAVGLTSAHLAYVIYTSGSTGQPKGVMLEHRSLVNLVTWQARETPAVAGARTLQFSSLSFDVSFQELFTTWQGGGCIVLVEDDVRRDPTKLLTLLQTARINRLFLPPNLLQILAEQADAFPLPDLQQLFTAGERLENTPVLRAALTRWSGCRVHNHYGPTETHAATAHALAADPHHWPALPPIGRPIANARLYLLDTQHQPVPIGVIGEIYVGGAGVARGYLNRPDLTAERFLASPFVAGDRLYRTGDLARYQADGILVFLGRNDDQVKIRGFRVELGEIQTRLADYPGVRDAVVVALEVAPGDQRLVAYYTPSTDAPLAAEALRSHLAGLLPDYMVPAAYVALQRLPLTASGKVDRKALPAPDLHAYTQRHYVAPHTPLQEVLAAIWADLLQLDRVGIHDNFFELGGHSLLVTRVAARLRQTLNIELPVRALFEGPTIHDLSRRLESGQPMQPALTTLRAHPSAATAVFFMPTIMGLGARYSALAQRIGADVAVYSCILPGAADALDPLTTIEAIAGYCADLLPRQHRHVVLAGWSFGGIVAYEAARQLAASGRSVARLLLIDAYTSIEDVNVRFDTLNSYMTHIGAAGDGEERWLREVAGANGTADGAGADGEDEREHAALQPLFRTNLDAMLAYRPAGYSGATVEIRADDSVRSMAHDSAGLQPLPAQQTRIAVLPGGHFSLLEGENLSRLAIFISKEVAILEIENTAHFKNDTQASFSLA